MNRRKNILDALTKKQHDKLPVFTVIDNFNYPQPLPKAIDIERIAACTDEDGFESPELLLELSRYYGTGTLLRITPSVIHKKAGSGFLVTKDVTETEVVTSYAGSAGVLKSISRPSGEAGTSFMTEHPVKSTDDYELLIEYFKSLEYKINKTNIRKTREQMNLIGQEGIAYAVIPSSPVMDLTRTWVGLENFYYHLMDECEQVESALAVMEEAYAKQCELIAANTPCRVLVMWDDSNSLYLSPHIFKKYAIPAIHRFAHIAHKHNKLLVLHTCGKFQALAELFLKTGVDAVDWVTPKPAGDIDPAALQQLWGDKITMMLACSPDIMRYGTCVTVNAHIHEMLRGVDIKKNVIFMLPPPYNTPIENLREAVKVLSDDYGTEINLSEKYGSIFDEMTDPVWSEAKTGAAPN